MAPSPLCDNDYLAVFDGPSIGNRSFGKFCGSTIPQDIKSTSNSLTLLFKTDSSQTARGWKISFRETLGKHLRYESLFLITSMFLCLIFFSQLIPADFHLNTEEAQLEGLIDKGCFTPRGVKSLENVWNDLVTIKKGMFQEPNNLRKEIGA